MFSSIPLPFSASARKQQRSEEDNTKAADTSVAAEGDADNSLDELLDAAMKDNQED